MAQSDFHRVVFVLLDGVGDVSIPALGNKTPLQASKIPTIDKLAKNGLVGLIDPVEPGLACGSDTAHLSLLGYPPNVFYRGRGAFESIGSGLDMEEGDIAFKSNFAVLEDSTGVVVHRRADRRFHEWGKPLCDHLNGMRLPNFPNVQVAVKYATEHRCGVRLRGPGLSDVISGTDPLRDGRKLVNCIALDDSAEAKYTADVVNELSREVSKQLTEHPLNVERKKKGDKFTNLVLFRGAGARIRVPPFPERHGLKGFFVAPTAIIAGMGKSIGLHRVRAKGATGDYRSYLRAKAAQVVETLFQEEEEKKEKDFQFAFLHVKGIDDASHDQDPVLKVRQIEKAEAMVTWLVGELQRRLKGDEIVLVVLTGDHSTPVEYGDHSCEAVPFLLCPVRQGEGEFTCEGFAKDTVQAFDEISAASGALGRFPGREVMPLIKKTLQLLSKAPQLRRH